MRYIAALAVLIDHLIVRICENGTLSDTWLPYAYKLGDVGVFVFFAISGFVMVISNREKFGAWRNSTDFFLRRIIRIWPMYFLATIVVFALRFNSDALYTLENLMKSISFIPYIGADDLYRPVLGKGWTLNYEMFFYAIFAVCLAFPRNLGLAVAGLALVVLAASEGHGANVLWRFYANDIVLYFFAGMALAYLIKETKVSWPRTSKASVGIVCAAIAFGLLFAIDVLLQDSWTKQVAMLLTTFICLCCVCFAETKFSSQKIRRIISILGDSSYCLYLFHGFFFVAMSPIIKHAKGAYLLMLVPMIIVVVTFGCAMIHLFIEKPLNRRLMSAYKNRGLVGAKVATGG